MTKVRHISVVDDEFHSGLRHSARYVRISLASQMTGLTVKAINQKIDQGVWREGREWHRGPDGNRYVDIEGYNAWVRSSSASRK